LQGAKEQPVDVHEIRKVEGYIRDKLGNAQLRIVPRPKKKDSADVLLGEKTIGVLSVNDDDGERDYNFGMPIAGADLKDIGKVEGYIRRLFGNTALHVAPRPNKKDSADLLLGEEQIGSLYVDDEGGKRSYNLEIPILSFDLETD